MSDIWPCIVGRNYQEPKQEIVKSGDEVNPDEAFLSVNLEGVLVKKNFDYYLIDKDEINDYIGREPTYIHQVLRVPFHGSLKLADFFISQLYPTSKFYDSAQDKVYKRNEKHNKGHKHKHGECNGHHEHEVEENAPNKPELNEKQ